MSQAIPSHSDTNEPRRQLRIQLQGLRPIDRPGGGSTYCTRVSEELRHRGHAVTRLHPQGSITGKVLDLPSGVVCLQHAPVRSTPVLWRLPTLGKVARYKRIVREYAADNDLIISHSLIYALASKQAFPATCVCYFLGNVESHAHRPADANQQLLTRMCRRLDRSLLHRLERSVLDTVDYVLVASSRNIERLRRCFGQVRPNWVVCPQGVDDLLAEVTLPRTEVRCRLNTPDNAIVIVHVGELDENKNARHVIDAIAALDNPNVYAWVLGDGPQHRKLQDAATNAHLAERIRFLGYRSPIEDYLAAADIFVSSSRYDTFPNAVLEAMVCGLPILGPKHDWNYGFSAIDEMCKPGAGSLLFEPHHLLSLVECLGFLVDNTDVRTAMGAEARRIALSRFSWHQHASQVIGLADKWFRGPRVPPKETCAQ